MLRLSMLSLLLLVVSPYVCIAVNGFKVDKPLEIVLVVEHVDQGNEQPGSVTRAEILNVVRAFPEHFQMSDDAVRMAVIIFNTFREILSNLTGNEAAIRNVRESAIPALLNPPKDYPGTEVAVTFNTYVKDVFKSARAGVPKFVLLIAHNFPTFEIYLPRGDEQAKEVADMLRKEGVTIIVGFVEHGATDRPDRRVTLKDRIEVYKNIAGDESLYRQFKDIDDIKKDISRLVEIFGPLRTSTSASSTESTSTSTIDVTTQKAATSTTTTTEPTTSTTTTEQTSSATSTKPTSSAEQTSSTTSTEQTSSTTSTEPTSTTSSTTSTEQSSSATSSTSVEQSSATTTTEESSSPTITNAEKATSSTENSTDGASPAISVEGPATSTDRHGAANQKKDVSGGSGSSFPGWAIALIVCVAVLLILAIIVALVVTRRKKRKAEAKRAKEKAQQEAAAKKKAAKEELAKRRASVKKLGEKKSTGKKGIGVSMDLAGRSISLSNDPGGAERRIGVSLRDEKTHVSMRKTDPTPSKSMSKGKGSR